MKYFVTLLILLSGVPVYAQGSPCIDLSKIKSVIKQNDGRLTELTSEQWEFLRGIYAMNPETPPGLPPGDKAVLAQKEGNDGGIVFFVDKDKACSPMPIPKQLLDMLKDVATGEKNPIGAGL